MKQQNVISQKTKKEIQQILLDMGYDVISLKGDHTQFCILCFKKVAIYTGHVHKNSKKILAGWCKNHKNLLDLSEACKNCIGCYGNWIQKMGLIELPFE